MTFPPHHWGAHPAGRACQFNGWEGRIRHTQGRYAQSCYCSPTRFCCTRLCRGCEQRVNVAVLVQLLSRSRASRDGWNGLRRKRGMISHQSNLVAAGSFYRKNITTSNPKDILKLTAFKMGVNVRTGTHVREAITNSSFDAH